MFRVNKNKCGNPLVIYRHLIAFTFANSLEIMHFFFSLLLFFVSLVIIRRLFQKVSQNHSKSTDVRVLSSKNNSGNTCDGVLS